MRRHLFQCAMPETKHSHLPHLKSLLPEPIVFFTVVTLQRRAVLANENVHDCLRGLWERSSAINGWFVGDYVIMPDHVHLFARPARTANSMKQWVQVWKSVSSRIILKQQGLVGPLWQDDYFDRYLRSHENYSEKWNYVESNPVRAGLVGKPEDWPFRGQVHRLSY